MAEQTAMSRRGVAWWGHNATPGTCACCGTAGRVYMGYNGGQSMAVQFCGTCTVSGHMGCEASAPTLVPDARERLARHLQMQSVATLDECRAHADAILAVITGQEN